MNFSTNQVRQIFVANSLKASFVDASDPVGTIYIHSNASGNGYVQYRGVDGVTRSDLIKKALITYAKSTDAEKLARPLKRVEVALDPNVNAGALISGEDYILRISFRNYIGLSEEDQYFKYGAVHAIAAMTTSEFYAKMAISLAKNFSREPSKLLDFYLSDGTAETLVLPETDEATLTGTYTSLIIEEVEQEWSLGTFASVPVNFNVQPTTIDVDGEDLIWGTVTALDPVNFVLNGKITADLEYFLMGERGDQYRMVGFPRVIKTTYLVDPELEYNYIDLRYFYAGEGEAVHRSEKDITIVVAKDLDPLTNNIIDAVNDALETEIEQL